MPSLHVRRIYLKLQNISAAVQMTLGPAVVMRTMLHHVARCAALQ